MQTAAEIRRRQAWLLAVMLPVALLTASAASFKWQFVLLYLTAAFLLNLFVRPPSQDRQTLIHLIVLSGTVPIAVRFFFGKELDVLGTVHVGAVLVVRSRIASAFGRRCIPRCGVAPPANTPGILGRRALHRGRIARPRCTSQFAIGPLAASTGIGYLLADFVRARHTLTDRHTG